LGYTLACWLYPFIPCRRCSGSGRRRAVFGGRTFGLCRRCDGSGRQLRPGRRVINYLRGHLADVVAAPDGRLFTSRDYRRGPVSSATYTRAWRNARKKALTPAQQRSPLAKVP
jgi:hypothetical protein